jgi:peroxiredoxin
MKTLSLFWSFAILSPLILLTGCDTHSVNAASESLPQNASKHITTRLPNNVINAWEIPAFKLKGLDGKTHRIQDWEGKIILLNFWASWCTPCQIEIKDLVQYQEKFSKQNLQVISIGLDDENKLKNVARTLNINYPVLIPEPQFHHDILSQWGDSTGAVPHNVVIAADGKISYIHRGPFNNDAFAEFIVPLLTTDTPST